MDLLFFEEYTKLKELVLKHEAILKNISTKDIKNEEVSDEVNAEVQSIKN